MKRVLCVFLMLIVMLSILPVNGLAATEESKVTYFEDGSYLVETISIVQGRASKTVTGNKANTYYANDGSMEWKAVLTGSFTFDGSTATCTASSCNVTIYNSSWYVISKSATKSGNTATATVTMGYKVLGITVNQVPATITLTCDKDGNLS